MQIPRGVVLLCAALAITSGCGSASPGSLIPDAPISSKCRFGASQTSVLVTEWSASEKANLEARLASGGAVAVAFSGCDLRLLPECRLEGGYTWQRTTPSTDLIEIKNEAELYSKLPLGAVALSGELKRSGTLYVETTVAGHRRVEGMTATQVPSSGECERATHLVSGLSLGAFVLSGAGEAGAHASAEVTKVGSAGGKLTRSAKVYRSAGDANSCSGATDEGPAGDCASPLQVFLAPIPGRAEEEGPPGTVRVDFVSASGIIRWDVFVDDQATCTTPCSRWVDPERPLVLRTREDAPDKLRVGRLDRELGPVQVAARPLQRGKLATGIVFTSLGGLGVLSGITLSAIGCSGDRAGLCTAGLISLGAGGVVAAGAVWLMLQSPARAEIRPLFQSGGLTVGLGPAGLAGSF
jgi:hypothetical protein